MLYEASGQMQSSGGTGREMMSTISGKWIKTLRAIAETDDRVFARLHNLLSEDRVEMEKLIEACEEEFNSLVAGGESEESSASEVLRELMKRLDNPCSHLLGQLAEGAPPAHVDRLITHIIRDEVEYGVPSVPRPSRQFSIYAMGKTSANGSICRRFIWVTFADASGKGLSDQDPGEVVRELGLAHFDAEGNAYRFELPAPVSGTYFIPTALDAELYEAWQRPDSGHAHPWGLTRHLETGLPCWPELLVETKEYLHDCVGELVTRPDGTTAVGPSKPNFRIGRKLPP